MTAVAGGETAGAKAAAARPEAAREAPRVAVHETERHARLALERARLAAGMGKWTTALVLLRAALQAEPDHPESLSFFGYCLAGAGEDLEAARHACRRALDMQPHVAAHHARLGCVYRAAHLERRAHECFRQALRLDPAEDVALAGLAALAARPLLVRLRERWRAARR